MTDAEMRGQDMQPAPERIWTVYWGTDGAVVNGAWADTVRHFGGGVEYTRTDLCITEAECQRLVDAAVAAEREACGAEVRRQFRIWEDFGASGFDDLCMAIIPEAIRARGQK